MKAASLIKATYRIILTVTFWKRLHSRDSKKISACQWFGRKEEKDAWVEHGIFRAVKLFCTIL